MMLEQLQRRSALEPDNQTLQLNVVAAMAREGRSLELIAPLMDRETWNKAGEYAQGLAAIEVGRRLGSDWELSGLRVWSCGIDRCKECGGRGKYWVTAPHRGPFFCKSCPSHRLATYTHKPSGIEFQLLPGRPPKTVIDVGPEECKLMNWEASQVTITDPAKPPFLIARWPVTQSQTINVFVGSKGFLKAEAKYYIGEPQKGWSFTDTAVWCKRFGLSLPTPSQWGYACKAGSETRFYWGDEFDPSHVWYAGNSGDEECEHCNGTRESSTGAFYICEYCNEDPRPHASAVHDKAGKWNSFGLVDCIGNVWEWNDNESFSGFSFRDGKTAITARTPMDWRGGDFSNVGFRPIKTIDWSE